jgi:hypothetical protein
MNENSSFGYHNCRERERSFHPVAKLGAPNCTKANRPALFSQMPLTVARW